MTEFLLKGKTFGLRSHTIPVSPTSAATSKLLQVFINLLKNALEAVEGARKKEVSVSTRLSHEYMVIYEGTGADRKPPKGKKRRWVVITIQDSGKGIPRDEMKKVFLPFYTMKAGGSGLGSDASRKS
ncbi:MAG: ATP-binding protein [Desulfomicrobium escambiense]|nr:ATP-binding protein [Desulfomicrobium escambiense]